MMLLRNRIVFHTWPTSAYLTTGMAERLRPDSPLKACQWVEHINQSQTLLLMRWWVMHQSEITGPCHASQPPKIPLIYSRWNRTGLTTHNWNGLIAFVSVCTTRNFPNQVALHFLLFPSFKMTKHHRSFTLQFRNTQSQQEHEVCQDLLYVWNISYLFTDLIMQMTLQRWIIHSIRGRFPRTKPGVGMSCESDMKKHHQDSRNRSARTSCRLEERWVNR